MATLAEVESAVLIFLGKGSSRVKGDTLEVFFKDVITELGAKSLRRQRVGVQFGRDFSFNLNDKTWYAECKNLNHDVGPDDLAHQILWFPSTSNVDYVAIVSPTPMTNVLNEYVRQHSFSHSFVDWTERAFVIV